MIRGYGLRQRCERGVTVAPLQVAKHLVVAAVLLDDVDDVMDLTAQKLHHRLISHPHGAEMIILRHLLCQCAEAFLRWRGQGEKSRFGALKNERISCVTRRGRWRVAAAAGVRSFRAFAVHDVEPCPITAEADGIWIPTSRAQA